LQLCYFQLFSGILVDIVKYEREHNEALRGFMLGMVSKSSFRNIDALPGRAPDKGGH